MPLLIKKSKIMEKNHKMLPMLAFSAPFQPFVALNKFNKVTKITYFALYEIHRIIFEKIISDWLIPHNVITFGPPKKK